MRTGTTAIWHQWNRGLKKWAAPLQMSGINNAIASNAVIKIYKSRGAWVAQLVKRLTLDVCEIEACIGSVLTVRACLGFSLFVSAPSLLVLSLKINKH